jgi:hypothetical protein
MPRESKFTDPFEHCDWLQARDLFRRLSFEPLPPTGIDTFQLSGRLWEFIYALAGCRMWLHHTNHLSDRELYTWLHDVFFNQPAADIPIEAQVDWLVDPTDFGNGDFPNAWLRYYASEADREDWATHFPADAMPLHVNPPFDRDRWLPTAFGRPNDVDSGSDDPFEDDVCTDSESDGSLNDDPLGLAAVDAAIRIEKNREQARLEEESSNLQKPIRGANDNSESEFWWYPVEKLQCTGLPIPPDELTEETLGGKLWELLHRLACRGFYVLHTNHLTDRAVYSALWRRGLREETLRPCELRNAGWYYDFIGSGSDEDVHCWLRHYATEEERAQHQKSWPKDSLPAKEEPAFNRDWRLPKGPL